MNGLEVSDLVIGHDGRSITLPLQLHVRRGTVTALLGPSGSGKSTLLATIAGIRMPLGGAVLVDGRDVTRTPIHERGIGIVFQEPLLFPHRDVAGNIAYGLERAGLPRDERAARIALLMDWLDIAGLGDRRWDELSGGQAQRVALARAIAPGPGVLLLDEPFSALDAPLRARLATDVGALARRQGIAVLHVTHDEREAAAMADAVVQMPMA